MRSSGSSRISPAMSSSESSRCRRCITRQRLTGAVTGAGGACARHDACRIQRAASRATAAVDPDLQLQRIQTLDEAMREGQPTMRLAAAVLTGLTFSIVVLSAAGIYAMMSFTVARRRREIGIRAALGADPRKLLIDIFRGRRPARVGRGDRHDCALGLEQLTATAGERLGAALILPGVALFMVMVGIVAAFGPARKGCACSRPKRCGATSVLGSAIRPPRASAPTQATAHLSRAGHPQRIRDAWIFSWPCCRMRPVTVPAASS